MTELGYLAIGRQLAEAWRANPTLVDPLVTTICPDEHRKAWRAVEMEHNYYAAAHAVGVPEATARTVLETWLERAQEQNASLEAAFQRARDVLFSGDWKARQHG